MSRMRTLALASATALLTCAALAAQTSATATEGPPQPIDGLLVKDPASLTPNEILSLQKKLADYGQLARYTSANAALAAGSAGRVVFFGDSITDAWGNGANAATFFPGKPYLDRGISGQTTPQMLVRFQQDVVALKPDAVTILAGTNDLAGNTGIETLDHVKDNLRSMAQIARANGIRVILASVLPTTDYPWRRGLQPAEKIRALNAWMEQFCHKNGDTYLDYYTALATPEGGMKPGLAKDGVHPTTAGYAVMAPLAQAAIDRALSDR